MSALQKMAMNMFSDMMANLPPDVQEKLSQIGEFTSMLDRRLTRIENDLVLIKAHHGINNEGSPDNDKRNGLGISHNGVGNNVGGS